MAFDWKESYDFGHIRVDAARRRIFNLANEFSARKDMTIARNSLSHLAGYARDYFPVEESLIFACCGEKDYKTHALEHRVLIDHVNKLLLTGVQSKDVSPQEFITKSAAVLEMWIFNHFIKLDPKVRPQLFKVAQKYADDKNKAMS